MMGGKTPETCSAANKRQDNKLLHQVGDLFECKTPVEIKNISGNLKEFITDL
jgi:hypothetical protein